MAHLSGGDPLSAILTLAILEANVRHVARDPVLALRHAQFDAPPPDSTRRPVSVSALAESLRIPYEAARRRVATLEAAGVCVRTGKGVYIPTAVLITEENRLALAGTFRALESLATEIQAAAPSFDLTGGAPGAPGPPPPAPDRLAARVSAEYVLRFAERLGVVAGDVGRGLILLAILRHNFEPLHRDPALARKYGGLAHLPPDDLLAPVSVLALAGELGQPFETTRRNVNRLIRGHRCARTRGGVIVPARALKTAVARGVLLAHLGDIQRTFGALARLGLTFGGNQPAPTPAD
ncbi:hypothetical protein [Phenylobacterium sp.]|uniref:hypothetical protein n=1 Tax=Phenylobacterium sp. TaxID=1871053 RepID=UPI0027318D73|nr:hypothetical protein [Phenylobacterium sp.]MDP1875028.1 hypothetical protein [Phenylobacterium sp.]MDP3491148.1 hypothetical protein [Phenylobacterium sp.]